MNDIAGSLIGDPVPYPHSPCIHIAGSVEELRRIQEPGIAMVSWQRKVSETVLDWLAALDPGVLPQARQIVAVSGIGDAVEEALDRAQMPEGPGRAFLIEDITALANEFARIMDVPYMRLRLSGVSNNACRKFHVDAVRARLVCTYRGTGSQYGFAAEGNEPEEIFTESTGCPMLLRGLDWRETPVSGLVHRSPPIEGTGQTRLVLVLDPIDDPAEEF